MHGDGVLALIEHIVGRGVGHAVVLMRHSARTFEKNLHDLANNLTEEGRALCGRVGRRLPKTLTLRAYSSPAQRCLDTAELILAAHKEAGGLTTRHRPVEGLGVFYVLDQMKMWRGMDQAGGMVPYLQAWFAGETPQDALMPADLASKLVLRVMAGKLAAPIASPQLDICVSHDMTLYLLRDRLLGETVDGAKVEFLDGLIAWRDAQGLWLQSQQGEPRQISLRLNLGAQTAAFMRGQRPTRGSAR